ncbi:ATP-binding protein [Neobacillus mesonae]|uniref:ATP-binding protein n=1 Tax=Neobacillus mesonae TaxID=1193713 RepID=UPI000832FDF0|nr:AAA family ATPase [Neobacillus mesonae]
MKIIGLHIYGYGKLADVVIENLTDFQVFYGENEAGKSTIMAFIHGVLFGFPTKQQSELRYEPKHHSKYGGKIRVYHEKTGYAVIERVKGRAAGDVTVVMDNGTIGGEELLKELLHHFDKSLYQAIFSFNLHGLQNIHQMKGEEIGKFLFSAGTLGTERLAKTEAILQKEMESRFKPSGKKPTLNGKLQALHELNSELKKSAAKNKEYEDLVRKGGMLQQKIDQLNSKLYDNQIRKEKLNEWNRIETLVKEEKMIKKELSDLGEFAEFPVRGIERLEKINQLIHPCKARLSSIGESIEQVKQELPRMNPDSLFLKAEPELLPLLDQIPIYEQLQLEMQQYETKLAGFEAELSMIKEKLHLRLNEEEICSINTNIYMKNQVETVSQRTKKLSEIKEELEKQYQEEKTSLEQIEKEISQTKSLCLSEQKRAHLEEQAAVKYDKKGLEEELKNTREKIEFCQISLDRDNNAKSGQKLQYVIIFAILAGLIVYGGLTKQWEIVTIGSAGAAVIAFFMLQSNREGKEKKGAQSLANLKETEKQIMQKLDSAKFFDLAKAEEQLERDQELREELKILTFKWKQQQVQFDKVISKFEAWELESAENKKNLVSLSKELNIPENMANLFLLEAYQLIEQYKSIVRDKQQLNHRLQEVNKQLVKIETGINAFADYHLSEKGISLQQSAYLLRNKLKMEHEKHIKSQEKKNKLAELENDWKQTQKELEHLNDEHHKLISSANANSEQQFYQFGEIAAKNQKLQEQLEAIQGQLQYSILSEQERDRFLGQHLNEGTMIEVNRETQQINHQLNTLQEELAAVKYEIQILEEGGVYSDLLHQFKQKMFQLAEDVKEWAVFSIAQDILMRTIDTYKNGHLPRMLVKAQEYLVFLTNGRYNRIHLNPAGIGFLVERQDHTIFEANELSQATTEQLYVAIRLALATTLYEKYQFPIIIDDSFVNFDTGRTKKVIELLKKLKGNQILFFTCHAHLLPLFAKENILLLEKDAVQIIS